MIPVLRFAASSTMKSDTNSKPSLGAVRAVFGHLEHIICFAGNDSDLFGTLCTLKQTCLVVLKVLKGPWTMPEQLQPWMKHTKP